MELKLTNLIDVEQFQTLQDRLNEIYSFPSAIIDLEGNVLTATAWQDVCTKFHRKHPECEQECIKSDQYIVEHLHEANPAVSYRCPHGLIDNATPIIIEGVHYGNFFTGQFFLEPPDLEFFRAQAKRFGFDEDAYLQAVGRVPVWSQQQLDSYLFFIKGLIEVISGSGLKNLRAIEAKKKVEEGEEHHRTILQTTLDGFWLVDRQGKLLEVNESYCRMSGYTAQELLRMSIPDLEASEDPAATDAHMRRVVSQGGDRFESKHRRKDGSVFDVEVTVQTLPLEGGPIVVFLRDVTEKRRAEHELARDLDAMKRLQRIGSLVVSADNLEPVLAEVVDAAIALSRSDFGNIQLLDPESGELRIAAQRGFPAWWIEFWDSVSKGKGVCGTALERVERIIVEDVEESPIFLGTPALEVQRNAGVRAVQSTPLVSRSGKTVGMFSTHYRTPHRPDDKTLQMLDLLARYAADILEHARAEEALLESEERWKFALEGAGDGVWDWDVQTNRVFFSPRWKTMLGFGEDEVGDTLDEWKRRLHPNDKPFVMAEVEKHFLGQTPLYASEHRVLRKDGTYMWVLDRGKVVSRTADGKPLRVIGTHADIMARKQAEAERETLREHLTQAHKMEAIGTLAGGIAHDFNNILGAILGYTELSVGMLPPSDPVRENLQEVLVASTRAKALVQQILAFGRKGEKKVASVDSGLLVTEVMKLLVSIIPKTVTIERDINLASGHVLADPTELHQVVMNLCTNAYQAMSGETGVLRVSLSGVKVDPVEASAVQGLSPGDYVRLDVVDNGSGMDSETLSRIFEPYFTTKAVGKGTGMGLALAYGIVTGSGGAISVQSQLGVGTKFTVYLPRHEPQGVTDGQEVSRPAQKGQGNILVVDDEPSIARLTKRILESLGYSVREVSDPMAAARLFESDPEGFDLVVTDQTMPGMTGAELARRVMALRPGTPVIMCTGYSDLVNEAGAKEMGIAAFVNKPFTRNQIGTAVANALGKDG